MVFKKVQHLTAAISEEQFKPYHDLTSNDHLAQGSAATAFAHPSAILHGVARLRPSQQQFDAFHTLPVPHDRCG